MAKTVIINVDEMRELTMSKRDILARYEDAKEKMWRTIYNDILGTGKAFTAAEISAMTGLSSSTIAALILWRKDFHRFPIQVEDRVIETVFYEFINGEIDFSRKITFNKRVKCYYRTNI